MVRYQRNWDNSWQHDKDGGTHEPVGTTPVKNLAFGIRTPGGLSTSPDTPVAQVVGPDRGQGCMFASSAVIPAAIECPPDAFSGLTSDLLRAGKALRFRARGHSMQPLIRDGDVLLVRPVDASAVCVGDVVLFHGEPGRVVVHRVIRIEATPEGRQFTVQGDVLSWPDGLIREAQVYGRVVTVERGAVQIDVQRPLMRALAWAAALRSRWGLGRGDRLRRIKGLAKRLPVFDKYLA